MTRNEIVAALTALGEALDRRGVEGEMYVVGGAAIALAYDSRRSTRDIDGVFEPKAAVYEAAGEVAQQLALPPGWLNDAVKGFLAGDDPQAAPILDVPGLRCLAASPRMLLALKVLAHRVGEDEDDVPLRASSSRSSLVASRALASEVRHPRLWPWRRNSTASSPMTPTYGAR